MTFIARVNPRYFAAIHHCAAKGDVRYYLNAVHIERHPAGGVLIVATNGNFMGAMHDLDGWLDPARESVLLGSVSKRLLSACTARRGADHEPPAQLWISEKFSLVSSQVETTEEPELFGETSHHTEKTELVDGAFPSWRKVMPSKRRTQVEPFPCLNGEYLEVFNKIGVLLSGQKQFGGGGIRLEASEGRGSVVVRFNHHELVDRFLGIVMPMHADPVESLLPAWAVLKDDDQKAA